MVDIFRLGMKPKSGQKMPGLDRIIIAKVRIGPVFSANARCESRNLNRAPSFAGPEGSLKRLLLGFREVLALTDRSGVAVG